jgi:hypothetical protein
MLVLAPSCGGTSAEPEPDPTPPASAAAPSCDPSGAQDLAVSGDDPAGFPPYAVAACTLAYVNVQGALVVRDLATGTETTIAPASERPRRPAASPDLVTWESDEGGRTVVRVRAGGAIRTLSGPFASAGEPRASGTSVVFTAWNGPAETDDTDVWVFDAPSGESRRVLGGAGQQRFADISTRYVVASDFSEDPDGRFDGNDTDLADLILFDRASGVVTSRRLPGKQAFPMLGDGDLLAYLAWGGIHPEPKLTSFELRTGTLLGEPAADRTITQVVYGGVYARPALAGGTLEWIDNPSGVTRLLRAPADGSAVPALVSGLDDLRLYAPAPTTSGTARGFTLLAAARTLGPDSTPRLRAIPR